MILARLRQETATLHQDVQRKIDLLSPQLTLERYVSILRAFQAFFVPWEIALQTQCPASLTELWKGRGRAALLGQDLTALGASPTPSSRWTTTPDLRDPGLWLGSLYVVEGSTLGGQVISRYLEERFSWQDGQGYRFFQGYGSQTAVRWRAMCAALESANDKGNQIVAGAHLTFGKLRESINAFL